MFKPFKFIFKLIGFLMLIVTLLPIIFLVIMYKDYKPPIEDFETHETLSFTSILESKLDEFLEDDTKEGFELSLTSGETNKILKDLYAKDNPNFGKTDETIPNSERKYAFSFGDYGGFKGVSVKHTKDFIRIEAGIEAGFNNIYYKTSITLDLKLETLPETIDDNPVTVYKLSIKNIKIGNLPILWMYDLSNKAFSLIAGNTLDETIKGIVSGYGNYDLETKSVWITTNDILGVLGDDGSGNAMLKALLGFIDEEELLSFETDDDEASIVLKLGKARSTKIQYVLDNHIDDEDDLAQMFQGQLSSLLLSSLDGSETIKYNMHEQSFNQMLDYYIGDQMNITESFEIGSNVYELSTKPLFAEFIDGKVNLTIIMTLNKQGSVHAFKTHFTLVTTPEIVNDNDLAFNILEIELGDDLTISNDKVTTILSLIGDNDFIEGNKVVVKDFLENFQSSGVSVDSISVSGKYLRFALRPDNASILSDLQGAIDDALTDILTDPVFSDVNDAYQDFLDDPTNPDAIEDILDAINNLPPDKQEEFYNSLLDSLDGVANLEDLLP